MGLCPAIIAEEDAITMGKPMRLFRNLVQILLRLIRRERLMHEKRIREYAGRLLALEEEMNRVSNSEDAINLRNGQARDSESQEYENT